MCCVGGVLCGQGKSDVDLQKLAKQTVRMIQVSADRGAEGTGLAWVEDGRVHTWKKPVAADSIPFQELFDAVLEALRSGSLVFNLRVQPLTEVYEADDQQPVTTSMTAVVHNGVVSNDKELTKKYLLKRDSQIDSEVIPLLYDIERLNNVDPCGRFESVLKRVVGGFTYLLLDAENPSHIYVAKNFKPCWLAYDQTKNVWVINSEKKNIIAGFGFVEHPAGDWWVRELPAYTLADLAVNGCYFDRKIDNAHQTHVPEPDPNKVLVICSGGLDSTTAAYIMKNHYGKEVTLCHVNYGHLAEHNEKLAIEALAEDMGTEPIFVDARFLKDLGKSGIIDADLKGVDEIEGIESLYAWVPARNFVLTAMITAICEARGIQYMTSGFNLEEAGVFPDNCITFFEKINELLPYATARGKIRLKTVLERFTKYEIVLLGYHFGVPYDLTYSCYYGDNDTEHASKAAPCGQCGPCCLRRWAFLKADVEDPELNRYQNPPPPTPWEGKTGFGETDVKKLIARLPVWGS